MDLLLHKVNLTDEVKFDYETSISPNFDLISKEIKNELEFYIQQHTKIWHKRYMRLTYYDEQSDSMLMFFIREYKQFLSMKTWNVVGVCLAEDWNEELEECGQIKAWLDTTLIPKEDELDWVEVLRLRQEQEERERKLDEKEQEKYDRLFS